MNEHTLQVFVSHGKEDNWIASQIAHCIEDCGASTFLDETNISKGDNFKKIIHDEIEKSQEFVALFTPWSAQRSWVWIEVGAAWFQQKRVVAVLYRLEIAELERLSGGKGILEDINFVKLNSFDEYLKGLSNRIMEVKE